MDKIKLKLLHETIDNYSNVKPNETKEGYFFRLILPEVIKLKNKGASLTDIVEILKTTIGLSYTSSEIANYYSRFKKRLYNKNYQKLIVINKTSSISDFITTEAGFNVSLYSPISIEYSITEYDLKKLPCFSRIVAKRYMYWYHIRDYDLIEGIEKEIGTEAYDIIKPNIDNIENYYRAHYNKTFELLTNKFLQSKITYDK